MTTDRVAALQARLDDARDLLMAELSRERPRDKTMTVIREQFNHLLEELKMLIVPEGKWLLCTVHVAR